MIRAELWRGEECIALWTDEDPGMTGPPDLAGSVVRLRSRGWLVWDDAELLGDAS